MQKKFDLIALGFNAVDYIYSIDKYPIEDTKTKIKKSMKLAGGQAATAAVTVSRLGFNTGYIGCFGDDENKNFGINELKKDNVDIANIIIRKNTSSHSANIFVSNETGKRTIFWQSGDSIKILPHEINYDYIKNTKVFLCDAHNLQTEIEVTNFCRKNKIKTVIDVDTIYNKKLLTGLLKNIDYIIVPYHFADRLFEKKFNNNKERCRFLYSFNPIQVILTKGEEGSVGMDAKDYIEMPPYKIKVVDTTGAGDVFHGAYICSILKNYSLSESLKFSNYISALKCQKFGAREGIPFKNSLSFNNYFKT